MISSFKEIILGLCNVLRMSNFLTSTADIPAFERNQIREFLGICPILYWFRLSHCFQYLLKLFSWKWGILRNGGVSEIKTALM